MDQGVAGADGWGRGDAEKVTIVWSGLTKIKLQSQYPFRWLCWQWSAVCAEELKR